MKNLYFPKLYLLLFAVVAGMLISTNHAKADTLFVSSNITPEQMVQEILIGGGVVTSNIEYTGNNVSRGKFWGGPGNINIEEGILLTSGNVNKAPGPNNAGNAGFDAGEPGDPDLNAISGSSTFDACVLEFDFIPQSTIVSFKYVFGSEEYHEYVNQFNDAFGFFISGPGIDGPFSNNSKNIALVPLTDIPVSINTINCGNPYNCQTSCTNCQFFVNNTQQFTQYDAFTKVLTAWANVIPCETYHIKLAIGDGIDHAFDSGCFLQKNSFSSVGIANEVTFTQPDIDFAIEGCNDLEIMFQLSIQPDADFYMPLMISGSAVNGVDYVEIPDSVFFQQGFSQAWMDITTIADGTSEWFENIRLVYNSSLCSIDYDTINIQLKDYQLSLDMTPDTTITCATQATIGVEEINGYGPFSLLWSTGDTTPYITVSPLISTTYYVTCAALCDSITIDSVRVEVDGAKSHAGPDLDVTYGFTTTLQGSASQGSGNYQFSWEPAALLDNPAIATPNTVVMLDPTLFTLTVTDLEGNCQDIDEMWVNIIGGPLNVTPFAEDDEICPESSTTLYANATGGSETYTYQWTSDPPGFSSTLANPVVYPSGTTTYYVVVNDGSAFFEEGNVTITVNELPVAEAGINDTIWYGAYGLLNGSASPGPGSNFDWSWEPSEKVITPYTQYTPTVNLTQTTLFWLTVTDKSTGCTSIEDFVTVEVLGGPLEAYATVTSDLICRSEYTQLFAVPSGGNPNTRSYSWESNPAGFMSTEQNPYIYPTGTTSYRVTVTDGINTFTSDWILVTVSTPPAVNLGPDTILCPFDTLVLHAKNQGMSYYWFNGSTEESISVGTTGIGFDLKKVWLNVENNDGCLGTDTILVAFDFAQCSGVEENEQRVSIYLFPNPTTGKINYEWTGLTGEVQMEITDLHGHIILNQSVMVPQSGFYKGLLDLGSQPDGIYLMKLISKDNVVVRKILLQ